MTLTEKRIMHGFPVGQQYNTQRPGQTHLNLAVETSRRGVCERHRTANHRIIEYHSARNNKFHHETQFVDPKIKCQKTGLAFARTDASSRPRRPKPGNPGAK
jgi:hypothetical protein